jgi:hypothetical protein
MEGTLPAQVARKRARTAFAENRFKPVGGHTRRPCATNGVSTLRGDEESACAHKLDARRRDEGLLMNPNYQSAEFVSAGRVDTVRS